MLFSGLGHAARATPHKLSCEAWDNELGGRVTDSSVWVFFHFVLRFGAGLVLSCRAGNYHIDLVVSSDL